MAPNPTRDVAFAFVKEFLGVDTFDSRYHGRYLREAKRFVNPDNDDAPIPPEDVLGCLRAMKAGLFGFDGEINTMYVITYGDPPYLQQYFQWKKTPPSWYEPHLVELWERITHQTAYPEPTQNVIMNFLPTRPR